MRAKGNLRAARCRRAVRRPAKRARNGGISGHVALSNGGSTLATDRQARVAATRGFSAGARSRKGHPGRCADGRLQRHAGLVQRRRPSTFAPRPRARAWTSSSREGADIVDIGGESTRPGAEPVPAARADRPRPRGGALRGRAAARASRSTRRSPEVAAACLDAGASRGERRVVPARRGARAGRARRSGAALVLMHARGHAGARCAGFSALPGRRLRRRRRATSSREWERAAERARCARASPREALVMDPGLGFAKNARQSLELLRAPRRSSSRAVGRPRRRRGEPQVVPRACARSPTPPTPARAPRRFGRGRPPRRAARAPPSSASTTCARRARPSTSSAPSRARRRRGERARRRGLMLEGFLHLFARRPVGKVAHRRRRHPARHLRRLPRAARPARDARDADGHRPRRHLPRLRRRRSGPGFITLFNLLNALLSSIILIVVVVFQNDIRRGLMRVGARAFFGGLARQQESQGHRRGRGGGDRARAPPHRGAHRLRAGREPRRVRRRAGDRASTRPCSASSS